MKVIPMADWARFFRTLAALDDRAAAELQAFISRRGGLEAVDRDALIAYAHGLATKYGEGAAALAAEMYDAVAATSGAAVLAAVPAATATYAETAAAINGTIKSMDPEIVCGAVGRLVKMAGVDTTMQNALRDGAEWAWIPQGDTCAYCLMMAGRGWQRASKKSIKNGHAEHIHANCDCTYAVRFDKDTGVEGYDPAAYAEAFDQAEGETWREKLNTMRRADYAENRDEINAQKRAAYARRQAREEP